MKKNVLYLHAGAELYGADKVLLDLLINLDKNLFNPIVILPTDGPLVKELKNNKVEVYVVEYPILRRKFFNFKGILSYPFLYLKYCKKISNIIEMNTIDIVHVNTTAVLEGIYFKIKYKIPLVWHIHEILLKPKFLFEFTSFLVQHYSDRIIVVSEAVEKHLLSSKTIKKEKIKIIYNGVNNQVFYPNNIPSKLKKEFNLPDDSIIVGMIGRINSWKGQKDFVQAVSLVMEIQTNVYGVIVGDVFEGEEHYKKELKNLIDSTGLSNRFRLIGFRFDTPEIYNLYDIFVLPSTQPDPLPTVVLEAMATGKPIVGYNHGGIMEMVKDTHNGILCEVNKPEELSKGILKLINNSELRLNYGKKSLTRQEKYFSLDSYVKNFSDIYLSIVNGGK